MDEEDHKVMDIIKVNDDDEEESEEEEEEEESLELECEGEEFIELEDEDFKELGELKAPVLTSWKGVNGETIYGLMVINDELTDPKNKCHLDVCPICYHSWTSHGNHQICCLPCGHMYGLSCIKKWLLQSSSGGKCPQCNTFCLYTDVILLYASRICASPHQRTSSSRHFPFTKEGFIEYKYNERCRRHDARKVYPDVAKQVRCISQQLQVAKDQQTEFMSQWNDIKKLLEGLEQVADKVGLRDDAWQQRTNALKSRADALKRRADASGRRVDALKRRADALEQHADALRVRVIEYLPRLNFFVQMYEEHQLKKKTIWILCNDCGTNSEVPFHVVAHKCPNCKSYNTRQTRG